MISKMVIKTTNWLKPVLLNIFPYELLRKCKGRMINLSFKKLENVKRPVYEKGIYSHGINIIGNIKAETGLGQSCRLVAGLIEKTGIPFSIYQYDQLGVLKTGDSTWDNRISDELPYDINLIHINPHELGIAYMQMDAGIWEHRYNIAYWLWELEEFPEEWIPCFNCVNEIWTPSEFISKAIRKKTNLPVRTIPYYLELEKGESFDREFFKLPEEKFLFLMMYDHSSVMERKNPIGALKAFKKAFSKDNNKVGLVIKINNYKDKDMQQIQAILDGYDNVYFIRETLSRDQVNSLIKCVNVFVSLHRAEGFGLVLAESMYLGTPTIATNWSSNIEFMNEDVACMVNYSLVTIEKDLPPFKAGNRWAEPDLEDAARWMRRLYEDKELYKRIKENAENFIRNVLSQKNLTQLLKNNVKEVFENRA